MTLDASQLQAIKYYEGDVQGDDPFWGDAKAYVTLNSLFYPGIDTERRRAAEGKRLNPAITADYTRLTDLCVSLLSACSATDLSKPRIAYRVERYADYLDMRQAGRTISFTSTSTGGFLPSYGDRIGIALLEFHIPSGAPCLPFSEVLDDDYAKSDEQEILLPPGLALSFEDASPTPEERSIVDAEGKPPIVKCLVSVVDAIHFVAPDDRAPQTANVSCDAERKEPESLPLRDPSDSEASARVYDALNGGLEPDFADVQRYIAWKEAFRRAVFHRASCL